MPYDEMRLYYICIIFLLFSYLHFLGNFPYVRDFCAVGPSPWGQV